MERRAHPRTAIDWKVQVSSASERRLPQARLVDASAAGLLMVLDEPAGLAVSQSIVVSVEPDDDSYVLVGDVSRVQRGADFRTYVAMTFRRVSGDDLDRWTNRWTSGPGGAVDTDATQGLDPEGLDVKGLGVEGLDVEGEPVALAS